MKSLFFILLALVASIALVSAATSDGPTNTAAGEECVLCEYIVTKIETYLNVNGTTEPQVLAFLEKDCAILGPLNATCISIVNAYGPAIINTIINDGNPEALCGDFGLCSSSSEAVEESKPIIKKVIGDEVCDVCDFLVKEIQTLILLNNTEAEIVAYLEKECAFFPPLNQTCVQIVQQYGITLIQDLINKVPPAQVCAALGLCGGSSSTSTGTGSSSSNSGSSATSGTGTGSGSGTSGNTGTGSGSGSAGFVKFH
ncbi:saposin B domain-containing protein [Cavenderia fasciculata]|uniref:Saposin B domain-containing protein n=1 Tax=Cavenderia fasciculata TaxID=261658 RepID=F4PIC0_CACFS|nr:saposin B domain-containing protein [Cavenderia fasciculata]EGG24554.1 saposin B domain-containing protein [Cavenderia fasciculata]|eukprot:XP_004362405.1 saposin B domain-containing protein [Cavenderia fasciculata]